MESEHEYRDGGMSENLDGRVVSRPNLSESVPLVSPSKGIPTIATKESSTERYSENI